MARFCFHNAYSWRIQWNTRTLFLLYNSRGYRRIIRIKMKHIHANGEARSRMRWSWNSSGKALNTAHNTNTQAHNTQVFHVLLLLLSFTLRRDMIERCPYFIESTRIFASFEWFYNFNLQYAMACLLHSYRQFPTENDGFVSRGDQQPKTVV